MENLNERLTEFFPNNEIIPLKEVTVPKITYYSQNTLGPVLVFKLMEKGLLSETEHQYWRAKPTEFDKNAFLWLEILNRKVQKKEQYLALCQALLASGNSHIVETLFEDMITRQVPASAVGNTTFNEAPSLPENTNETPLLPGTTNETTPTEISIKSKVGSIAIGVAISCVVLLFLNKLSTVQKDQFTTALAVTQPAFHPRPSTSSSPKSAVVVKSGQLSATLSPGLKNTQHSNAQHSKFIPVKIPEVELETSTPYSQSSGTTCSPVQPFLLNTLEDQTLFPQTIFSSTESPETFSPNAPLPKNNVSLTIGSPKDWFDSIEGSEVHLTINNSISKGDRWEDWSPKNANNVASLNLNGIFSPREIRHFLSIMTNLNSLGVGNLTGKLCGKHFNFVSNPLVYKKLQNLRITHLEDQQCKSVYQFLTDSFNFTSLRRLEILNLPITADNEEFIGNFLKKYELQLTKCDFRNVFVGLGSNAFVNLKFENLASLHIEFREPFSEGAKSIFAYLNRATPNLIDVSTNIVCSEEERVAYNKNWPKIKGMKRMLCDLRKKS